MKKIMSKLLFILSIVLFLVFTIVIFIDYFNYDFITNSAPFSSLVIIRSWEFLLPSIISLLVSKHLKNEYKWKITYIFY